MAKTRYTFEPDYAISPGATLKETLDAKGLTQAHLCMRSGLNPKTVSEIISGAAPVTLDTAEKFELVLGIPARFWNNRELRYRETLARVQAAERLEEDAAWLKLLPVSVLVERNYMVPTADKAAQVRQAMKFFGVSSVEAWQVTWGNPVAKYRGGNVQKSPPRQGCSLAAHGRTRG